MTRKVLHPFAACAAIAVLASCSGANSDVRKTAFEPTGANKVSSELDSGAEWSCGDADLQAVFSPSFTGESLVAAVKSAIADPAKADASFSFVDPIESFYTQFDARALCMQIETQATRPQTDALVAQLRRTGNVVSVRAR